MNLVSPNDVLRQVAQALAPECRGELIIIGSLAAAYYFFGDDPESQVRTKDVDCMLSPHIKAVPIAKTIAEDLFHANWQLRADDRWGKPGDAFTPVDELPLVRLRPPGETEWFIELMSSPGPGEEQGKKYIRLETDRGHFCLCSFGFLSLVEEQPIVTEFGIAIARPEMMALANLLHHPRLAPATASGLIEGRSIKRSNKDLGRVLALAFLSTGRNEDALRAWPDLWAAALASRFPVTWKALAARAGSGLRQLLASEPDLEEASHSCSFGLLASSRPSPKVLRIAGRRLLQDAVEPLEATVI